MVGVTFQALMARAAGSTAVLTYVASTTSSATTSAITFTAHAIGTAASDRIVIVCAESVASGGTSDISGVTVGGNSATLIVKTNSASAGFGTAIGIYALLVTTGTTADIVVTYAGAQVRGAISVYTLTATGGVATPYHTNSAISATPTASTINTLSGGAALGYVAFGSTGGVTWTGLTEDVDSNVAGAALQYSGAHTNATSAATAAAVSTAATGNGILVVASW